MNDLLGPPKPKLVKSSSKAEYFSSKEKQVAYQAFTEAYTICTSKKEDQTNNNPIPFAMIVFAALKVLSARKNVNPQYFEKLIDEASKLLASEAESKQVPQ